MSTKSVYIFGLVYLFGNDYLPTYKELNELAKKYFKKVVGTYSDFWDLKEMPQDFNKRTYEIKHVSYGKSVALFGGSLMYQMVAELGRRAGSSSDRCLSEL